MYPRSRAFLFVILLFLLSGISVFAQNTPADRFKSRLDGAWVKKEKDGSSTIINYNYSSNDIIMFSDAMGVQEVYLCSQFSPTVRENTWYLLGTNDMVPFIRMNITVRLESDNVCHFTVREEGIKNEGIIWNGKYERMTEYGEKKAPKEEKQFVLDGKYESDTMTLVFSKHNFTLTDEKGDKSGLAALYDFGDISILELRFLGKEGKLESLLQYKFERSITENDDVIIVEITMLPGKIKIHGFKPSGEPKLVLTQKIAKETE
ncbi:MAG: hypothetical protein J6U56_09500 [Spirochaetia bacterium]|nr:hypothetical protein [Spirochaetia bacterium]